jgi:tetraacyldisaccharide-1-P 4'-kinase
MIEYVSKYTSHITVQSYPDHHNFSKQEIENLAHLVAQKEAIVLTTEKDAVKLRRSRRVPQLVRERLFYQPLKVEFLAGSDNDFFGTLKDDLDGKVHIGDLTIGDDN